MSFQTKLTERAARSGFVLKYRYNGMTTHPKFAGTNHCWALIKSWDIQTFKTLFEVSVALEKYEQSLRNR